MAGKVDFPYGSHRPLKYYKEYLQYGCYPFFTEEDFPIKLRQAINATVEDDIPRYAEMTVAAAVKLKKLMYMIAQSVPYKPNYSTLARDLDISRNILPDYIDYLEKSGLLQKVEKLFLDNSNIIHSLGLDKTDEGTIRETMFLTWMKCKYSVYSSKISDFEIGDMTFEVGGRYCKRQYRVCGRKEYPYMDVWVYLLTQCR